MARGGRDLYETIDVRRVKMHLARRAGRARVDRPREL